MPPAAARRHTRRRQRRRRRRRRRLVPAAAAGVAVGAAAAAAAVPLPPLRLPLHPRLPLPLPPPPPAAAAPPAAAPPPPPSFAGTPAENRALSKRCCAASARYPRLGVAIAEHLGMSATEWRVH